METTIKTNQAQTFSKSEKVNTTKSISVFWEKIEFSRYGIISMMVVFLGCIGGLAASFGAGNDVLQLGLIVFPTIISLALILAVVPMRVIVYVSTIAIILDLLVLVF